MGRSCGEVMWGGHVGRPCGEAMWGGHVGRSCGEVMWGSVVGRSCGEVVRKGRVQRLGRSSGGHDLMFAFACISIGSSESGRRPAVSLSRTGKPPSSSVTCTTSRVVPALGETMAAGLLRKGCEDHGDIWARG